MSDSRTPNVVSADRLGSSLIITFEDGRCALYNSDLLYATLPQARELSVENDDFQAEGESVPLSPVGNFD